MTVSREHLEVKTTPRLSFRHLLRQYPETLSQERDREVESAFRRRPVHLSSKPAAGMAPGSAAV